MRVFASVLCCFLITPPLIGQEPDARAKDDMAVREVIQRYMTAREREDPAGIEALFTPDADQYTTAGEWRRGRASVVPGTLQASARNPGTRAIRVEAVRFVTPDVAVADGPYELPTGGTAERRVWTTIVLTREAGGWRIAAIRNMAPTSTGGR
jgi:uncharacterized protein (TIGR02246 family)